MSANFESIRESFSHYRKNEKARHRDIAERLSISEATLISSHVGIEIDDFHIMKVIKLKEDWKSVLSKMEDIGIVMSLTRNNSCVSEIKGIYKQIIRECEIGLVSGDIELRTFYGKWKYGFAVIENNDSNISYSY